MLDEVNAFNKRLLDNMSGNELDPKLLRKIQLAVKKNTINLQLLETKRASLNEEDFMDAIAGLEHLVDVVIYEFDSKVKLNSNIVFLSNAQLKKCLGMGHDVNETFEKEFKRCENFYSSDYSSNDDEDENESENEDKDEQNFKIDFTTTFGFLFVMNDCVAKENFEYLEIFFIEDLKFGLYFRT